MFMMRRLTAQRLSPIRHHNTLGNPNSLKGFLAMAIMLVSAATRAEGGCPEGEYPQQGPGWQTCAPIPGYDSNQQAATRPLMRDRWGAIATDGKLGVLGSVNNADSEASARLNAFNDCRSKGGTRCELKSVYKNGCGAMSVGANGFATASGPTEMDALESSLRECRSDGDTRCQRYYSGCSTPLRTN